MPLSFSVAFWFRSILATEAVRPACRRVIRRSKPEANALELRRRSLPPQSSRDRVEATPQLVPVAPLESSAPAFSPWRGEAVILSFQWSNAANPRFLDDHSREPHASEIRCDIRKATLSSLAPERFCQHNRRGVRHPCRIHA